MKRDQYWDSLKLVLMFLVIYGHMIEKYATDGSFNRAMFSFIYLFHMPLFIYISGMFSQFKEKEKYKKGILKLLETYVVFQIIRCVCFSFMEEDISLISFLIIPKWTLWYLMSLIFWRLTVLILPKKMLSSHPKRILLICFIISIIGGFVPLNSEFSIQRTLTFLPFFYLGYYSYKIDIKKIINKIPFVLSWTIPLLIFLFIFFCLNIDLQFLNGKSYFWALKESVFTCMWARIAMMASAMVLSVMTMRMMLNKTIFPKWGEKTLFIYIFHTFIIDIIRLLIKKGYMGNHECLLFLYSIVILVFLGIISKYKFSNAILNPVSYYFSRNKK